MGGRRTRNERSVVLRVRNMTRRDHVTCSVANGAARSREPLSRAGILGELRR